MAKNQQVVTPRGVFVYPHLHAPDTKFNAAGVFHTKLRLEESSPEVQKFIKKVKDAYKSFAKEEGLKVRKDGLPWKQDEDNPGHIILTAKMQHEVTPRRGEPFTQVPVIVDASRKELVAGVNIGGGTEGRLSCVLVPYTGFGGGISLRLQAVQVLKLVEFTGGAGDFGFEEEEGFEAPDDPFDSSDDDDDEDEFGGDEEDEYGEDDF